MIGAIVGDVIGSVHEFRATKTKVFRLFGNGNTYTDDTVLTVAVADAILTRREYGPVLAEYAERHPRAGYGRAFTRWAKSWDRRPYGSWGNGSAMRVSPVGWAFDTVREVLCEARRSAEVTHDHPEGIKGAQAVALAVFRARKGAGKTLIKEELCERFGYDLSRSLAQIRPAYGFDTSCQGSVPEAVLAFLESESYEDAVRNAVSLGGDADTQACIAGSIAEAFYGVVPGELAETVWDMLPPDLRVAADAFRTQHMGDARAGRALRARRGGFGPTPTAAEAGGKRPASNLPLASCGRRLRE
jgi:ADP-ribosylglycohydrolase